MCFPISVSSTPYLRLCSRQFKLPSQPLILTIMVHAPCRFEFFGEIVAGEFFYCSDARHDEPISSSDDEPNVFRVQLVPAYLLDDSGLMVHPVTNMLISIERFANEFFRPTTTLDEDLDRLFGTGTDETMTEVASLWDDDLDGDVLDSDDEPAPKRTRHNDDDAESI